MKHPLGSPIHFTTEPANICITFTTDKETWTLPLIGWAIVTDELTNDETGTHIEAVVLDDEPGFPGPMLLNDYLTVRASGITYRYEVQP